MYFAPRQEGGGTFLFVARDPFGMQSLVAGFATLETLKPGIITEETKP